MVEKLVRDKILPASKQESAVASLRGYWTDRIAVVWTVEDLQDVWPQLSRQQARETLQDALHKHDAEYGITWQVLAEYRPEDGEEDEEDRAPETEYGDCRRCDEPLDVAGYCTNSECVYYGHLQNQPSDAD